MRVSSKGTSIKRARLDTEMVRRGLAATRSEAKRAIAEGKVSLGGVPSPSPATLVGPSDPIGVTEPRARFVSRGGEKLDGALRSLDVEVAGRRWLDVGASTGGFTDRLLQGGASEVIALDVGYGQLDWRLRNDERVHVMERTNVRNLVRADLPWSPAGVVGDLSFISLTLVLPALRRVAKEDADHLLLVKPQFEVGRNEVGKGGVVADPELWEASIRKVVGSAAQAGLGLVDAAPSLLPGPSGNREFFVHLRAGADTNDAAIGAAIRAAP